MILGDELGYERKIENDKRRIWGRDQLRERNQQEDKGGDHQERRREKGEKY